jgi:hypothetical protein
LTDVTGGGVQHQATVRGAGRVSDRAPDFPPLVWRDDRGTIAGIPPMSFSALRTMAANGHSVDVPTISRRHCNNDRARPGAAMQRVLDR